MRTATKTFLALGATLAIASSAAHALGFGRTANATLLGQPLNFAAVVRLEEGETLSRECVSAEVLSGDTRLPPAALRVTVEPSAEPAEQIVRITTTVGIDEPVVTINVAVGCASRTARRYVVFVDPPVIALPQAEAPDASLLAPQRFDSQVAPIVAVSRATAASAPAPTVTRAGGSRDAAASPSGASAPRRTPRPRAVAAGGSEATARVVTPRAAKRKAAAPPATAAAVARPAAAATSRLKLEPAAALRAVAPAASGPDRAAATAAEAASAAAAQAAASALAVAAAQEQQRMKMLEDSLARLRNESQMTRDALVTLQSQLAQAESRRYANPLVYGLGALSALLVALVGWLLWRQSNARREAWWAQEPARAPSPPSVAPTTMADASLGEKVETRPSVMGSRAMPLDMPPHASQRGWSEQSAAGSPAPKWRPVAAPAPAPTPPAGSPTEGAGAPRRELSVEELIDLEQQADFFVVLGQDEAAIDLLMGHVRHTGGISPLPYLKLLEIYRRRGDHDAYERIRERFNRRFNAYAPDWDADLKQGRSLEDYPAIMARIQGMWALPALVMETLDASLFRRDEDSETFDLPAYRELLFLYAIARDLGTQEGSPPASIDVLLPLDDETPGVPISRLMATAAIELPSGDNATMPLDLDISLPDADEGHKR